YHVGQGYFRFHWEGRRLLYARSSECDFDLDTRTRLRLPPIASGLQLISVHDLVDAALKGRFSRPARRLINVFVSADDGRLLVHIPEKWAQSEEGSDTWEAYDGAILLVTLNGSTSMQIVQVNPSEYRSSWKLDLPQLSASDSDQVLKSAAC